MLTAKKYLIITLLCLVSHALHAIVPFGDFTNWTPDSLGYPDPDGWESSNLSDARQTIFPDVDRTGGPGYSAKFVTLYDSSSLYYHGHLAQNNQPFNGPTRPLWLEGFWQVSQTTFNSLMWLEVHVYNAASVEIGYGDASTPAVGNWTVWQPFNCPITYTTNDAVAYYQIDIFLSTFVTLPTLVGHIDDLSFDVTTTGMVDITTAALSYTLRNMQGSYILDVDKANSGPMQINIFDQNGRLINALANSNFVAGFHQFEFDLGRHSRGIYFCRIDDGVRPRVLKLIN